MADQKSLPQEQKFALSINLDSTPIFYTDSINMTTNEDGLVLDICQKLGTSNQLRVVTRIGMSRSHAKKFLQKLNNLLALTEGRIQTDTKVKN